MKFRQVAQRIVDLDRAVSFYSELLGKPPIAAFYPPGFGFFDLDGVRLFLDVNAASTLIYLEVKDVRDTIEQLRAKGHMVTTEPHVVFPDDDGLFDAPGNEWLAFIEDSEGNQVGLMSREIKGKEI
jgi:methylmalonyl-CoA/ethylmalonyl-CoA epimerase